MPSFDVRAPMAGSIKDVLVAPGARVTTGQEILVVESMKMEIPIECPAAGAVVEILVAPAQPIEEGQVLLRLDVS